MTVPLFATSHDRYTAELRERIGAVIEGGRYILGPEVEAFEQEFADYLGVGHCIGVANGTDAITIALKALGIGPGDEVVIPSFTFYATAEATVNAGARPVFCDIDPDTFCITAETVERALTPGTQGDRRRSPVRKRRARAASSSASGSRSSRTRRRRPAPASTARWRAPSETPPPSRSSPRRTSSASATAARSPRTTTRWPRACGGCASTARRTSRRSSTWASTRASTSCRRPRCACSCRSSTAGREARRSVAREYEQQGLGDVMQLPQPVSGAEPVYHLYVARSERSDELLGGAVRRGRRGAPLLPPPGAPPAGHGAVCGPLARPARHGRSPQARTWLCRWVQSWIPVRFRRSSKRAAEVLAP